MNTIIDKIRISGYKSISPELPLELDLGSINILLGANGAGKSNIVSFFRLLESMMKGSLQRYVAQMGINQMFLYYGPKKTPVLSATLFFSKETLQQSYQFKLSVALLDRLIYDDEMISRQHLPNSFNESALSDTVNAGLLEVKRWLGTVGN